jgi:hypothetical protein
MTIAAPAPTSRPDLPATGPGRPDPRASVVMITWNRRDEAVRAVARLLALPELMRRSWPVVAGRVGAAWAAGPDGRAGLRAALPDVPAALRARVRLPRRVEADARLLEARG